MFALCDLILRFLKNVFARYARVSC